MSLFPHGGTSGDAFREEVCCFGDSITQHGHCAHGWVTGLQEAYRRRADVLNRGYSGYSSRFGVHMLPRLFGPARRYLFTTVFFGANDAADAASKPAQHVPLGEYEANMAAIVHAARQVSRCVIVIAPPPVDEARWDNRTDARAREYGAVAAKVAAAAAATAPAGSVLFVDTHALMTQAPAPYTGDAPAGPFDPAVHPHWHAYLSDGLHLSPAGNALLARAVLAALEAGCPALLPTALTADFPVWRDIAPGDGAAAAFTAEALAAFHASTQEVP